MEPAYAAHGRNLKAPSCFNNGTTKVGTGTLSGGKTTFNIFLAVGTSSITADYGGSPDFAASKSAVLAQKVNLAATSTTLASSVNPSSFGQSVTFTATVKSATSGTPTGTVTFNNGTTPLGKATLSAGKATFTTSALAVGTSSITAVYGGGTDFTASTSPALKQTVKQAATSTTLASSPNPSTFGQSVIFTATVKSATSGTPTGTVTFNNGTTPLGKGTLSNGGEALFKTSTLAVGAHSITAVYGGGTDFTASKSPVLKQTVN